MAAPVWCSGFAFRPLCIRAERRPTLNLPIRYYSSGIIPSLPYITLFRTEAYCAARPSDRKSEPKRATPVLVFFSEMTIGRVATAKLVSIDPVGAEPWFFFLPANPNFFLNPSNHLRLTRASTYQTRGNPGNAGPAARCKSLIEKGSNLKKQTQPKFVSQNARPAAFATIEESACTRAVARSKAAQ